MNILAVVLLLAQAPIWTVSPPLASVGDTVRLTRRVIAGPEVQSTALPLEPTETYTPLSPPIVAYSEGEIVVRYQLAFFETGDLAVEMPDLELAVRVWWRGRQRRYMCVQSSPQTTACQHLNPHLARYHAFSIV